jgi:hypothetical protein
VVFILLARYATAKLGFGLVLIIIIILYKKSGKVDVTREVGTFGLFSRKKGGER